jgi:hypothetical protein
MSEDLIGIKNALKFLIERKMYDDISEAQCDADYLHSYKKGDREKAAERVKKIYKPILDGLK